MFTKQAGMLRLEFRDSELRFMSWFRKTKDTITVEFFESGADSPFVVSEVPNEQLPDTFELETNLEIAEQQWIVTQAIPQNKADFIKTGKLQIFLDKVQYIDPSEILYSLPTINDALFEIENSTSENLFLIHEDDWRQMEFISKKHSPEIGQEIKSIIEIYEQHKVGIGFNKIHLRQTITQPLLDENISLDELFAELEIIKKYEGFGVKNNKAKNSFAFQTVGETTLYGQTKDGRITFLCSNNNSSESIKKLVEKYPIVFVDWCRAEVIE